MSGKTALRWVCATYACLLRLFPAPFLTAYGDEMRGVFEMEVAEAASQGWLPVARAFLRELRDLPLAALQERMLALRQRPATASGPYLLETLSRWEMLAALAVFLIPAGLILLNAAPTSWVLKTVPPVMAVLLLVGSITGWVRRFPRWSLPYFGLILSAIIFLYLFQWEAERIATQLAARFVLEGRDEVGRLLVTAFWEGVVWLSLLALVALAIALLTFVPRSTMALQSLQEDWTRLSYLLYGASALALVLTFDRQRQPMPYALMALFCLAGGAWGYLRSSHPRRGFLSLLAGVTSAMWVTAAGVWIFAPYQDWTTWLRWTMLQDERWFEVGKTLVNWIWMVVVLALPGLAQKIARFPNLVLNRHGSGQGA